MFGLYKHELIDHWIYYEDPPSIVRLAVIAFLMDLCDNPAAVIAVNTQDEHGREMYEATVPGTDVTVRYVVTTKPPYDHNGIHLVRISGSST